MQIKNFPYNSCHFLLNCFVLDAVSIQSGLPPFNHQIYYIPHPRNRQEKFKRASLINSSEKVSNYVILV